MCYIDRAIRTDPQAPMRVSRVAQQCGSRLSGGSEQSLWNRTKNNTKERYRKQNDVLRAPKPYLRDAGRNSIVGLLNFLFYLFMYFEVKTQPGSGACCIWPRCPQVSEKSLYPKTLFCLVLVLYVEIHCAVRWNSCQFHRNSQFPSFRLALDLMRKKKKREREVCGLLLNYHFFY